MSRSREVKSWSSLSWPTQVEPPSSPPCMAARRVPSCSPSCSAILARARQVASKVSAGTSYSDRRRGSAWASMAATEVTACARTVASGEAKRAGIASSSRTPSSRSGAASKAARTSLRSASPRLACARAGFARPSSPAGVLKDPPRVLFLVDDQGEPGRGASRRETARRDRPAQPL